MGELRRRRHLEALDHAALRVEARHDVRDRAALARGIDALEDDQQPLPVLGPEAILERPEPLEVAGDQGLGLLLVVAMRRRRVDLLEVDVRARLHAEQVAERRSVGHRVSRVWIRVRSTMAGYVAAHGAARTMTLTAARPHPIYLAGRWVESDDPLVVANPADAAHPAGSTFHATPEQYETAVDAAVRAFEVTRTLPAYERGRILREISGGIKARREEIGSLLSLEAGKPIRDALVEVDRAVLTFRLGAEEAERMVGEMIPLDLMASSKGRVGITRRFAGRTGRGDQPLQLPAQPRRPQARPGDRRRLLDRPQAAVEGPADDAHGGRDHRRRRAPGRRREHPPDVPGARRPDGRRRAIQGPLVHRQPIRRLADEGAGGQEEGHPRAGRQRRRHRRSDGGPRLGRSSGSSRARSPMRGRSASASSGCSSTRTSARPSWTGSSPASRTSSSVTLRIPRRISGRWSTGRQRRGPSAGSTRPSPSAGGSARAARRMAPSSRRPCSRTCRSAPRSAATRRSRRSSWSSASPTSGTPSARSTTASSASRPASSRTTSATPGGRSTSSRSAASSSTTSRRTASTTCPTAGSRIPASAGKASAGRSRT